MGEDADGAAESVTKLQQQISGLTGVNIMSDSETFRDVYDVLKRHIRCMGRSYG